jgi:hypothetical protein
LPMQKLTTWLISRTQSPIFETQCEGKVDCSRSPASAGR